MKVVSIVNMKGGVAKTTLAINLADMLSRRYSKSVLIIDVDPQFNATQCLFSGEDYIDKLDNGSHTIIDIFDENYQPTVNPVKGPGIKKPVELKDIVPWEVNSCLDLIPGNLELHRIDMPAGQGRERRIKRYLEESKAEDTYDFVIIDTPPTPSAWMISALLASDSYIVPLKPEPLSRTGIDLLKGVVERFCNNHGIKLKCLGVVVTMAEENTKVYSDTIHYLDNNPTWAGKRFTNVLPKRTEVAREQGNQRLIPNFDTQNQLTIENIS